jgi:hypothetical protein
VYLRLCEFFHRADKRYNSGLFHFQDDPDRQEPADELTLGLEIDDKPLKEILRSLYYPDSPYEFSVLPAEILGHVYKQFLDKVISLTPGHRARVEYKPEVRKAGGVYYTPSYLDIVTLNPYPYPFTLLLNHAPDLNEYYSKQPTIHVYDEIFSMNILLYAFS